MAVFVRSESASSPPGLGKLVSVSGPLATVEYFHSPIDDPTVVTLPTSTLRQTEVTPQTRAHWFDPALHAWRIGRILDGEGDRTRHSVPERRRETSSRDPPSHSLGQAHC